MFLYLNPTKNVSNRCLKTFSRLATMKVIMWVMTTVIQWDMIQDMISEQCRQIKQKDYANNITEGI